MTQSKQAISKCGLAHDTRSRPRERTRYYYVQTQCDDDVDTTTSNVTPPSRPNTIVSRKSSFWGRTNNEVLRSPRTRPRLAGQRSLCACVCAQKVFRLVVANSEVGRRWAPLLTHMGTTGVLFLCVWGRVTSSRKKIDHLTTLAHTRALTHTHIHTQGWLFVYDVCAHRFACGMALR